MKVKQLRIEKGFSQEQLAAMAGVSTRTLQRIERGANASPETLKCLASALETDFSELRETLPMPAHTPNPPAVAAQNPTTQLTPDMMEAVDAYEASKDRLETIRSFPGHLTKYAVVMGLLALVNIITSPDVLWVIWPALGWGIAVASHGWDAHKAQQQEYRSAVHSSHQSQSH